MPWPSTDDEDDDVWDVDGWGCGCGYYYYGGEMKKKKGEKSHALPTELRSWKKQKSPRRSDVEKTNIITILRVVGGIYIIIIIIIMLVLAPAWSSESRLWTANSMRQKIKKIHRATPIYFST